MDCNKTDCIHYKVCEEWKSLGNDNYINESNGNCDCYSSPYNPSGDCISREDLKETFDGAFFDDEDDYKKSLRIIDNAPTVDIKDELAGAYNEGYMCGSREAEKARPQGEYVDISKLRLMTVEECAGYTIDYAMGWKACIEWIKKGGADMRKEK